MKHTAKYYKLFLYFICSVFISCSINCHKTNSSEPENTIDDLAGYKVAVYIDNGVFDACRTNTITMLNEINCNYTAINKDSILSGCLDHYGLLLMPGGDMWTYNNYLGSKGMNVIKEYISSGGGYIGICGGAYFAASKIIWHGWAGQPRENISISGLNLFNGNSEGPIEDFAPSYVVNQCRINLLILNHPVCKDIQGDIAPYYDHGPEFTFDSSQSISVLGETETGNHKAILTFNYNSGHVFIISCHPEFDVTKQSRKIIRNAIMWCAQLK